MSTESTQLCPLGFDVDFSIPPEESESLLNLKNNGRVNRSLLTQESIGKTGYSVYVRHVQYGTYNAKPACLVALDFSFRFPSTSGGRFSSAEIEITFEKVVDPKNPSIASTDSSMDPIVENFAPKHMLGQAREKESNTSFEVEIPVMFGIPLVSAGVVPSWSKGSKKTEEGRAELHGNLAQDDDHDDGANSVTWDLTENPVSQKGIFRSFRGAVLLSCGLQDSLWLRISVKPVVKFSLDPRRLARRLMQEKDEPVLLDGSTMLGHSSFSSYTDFTDPDFPWQQLLQVPGGLGTESLLIKP